MWIPGNKSHLTIRGNYCRRPGPSRLARQPSAAEQVQDSRRLEGEAVANPGDWILRGCKGEQWVVPAQQFEDTYEGPLDAGQDPAQVRVALGLSDGSRVSGARCGIQVAAEDKITDASPARHRQNKEPLSSRPAIGASVQRCFCAFPASPPAPCVSWHRYGPSRGRYAPQRCEPTT